MSKMRYLTDTQEITIDGARVGSIRAIDLWQGRESPEQAREMVATIASLSYGNEAARNPDALYEQIVRRGHLSCLEFVPAILDDGPLPSNSIRAMGGVTPHDKPIDVSGLSSDYPATGFLVECPLIVRAQWMRHRSYSYLEMSRRYVKGSKIPFTFYAVGQDPMLDALYEQAIVVYNHLLDIGWKPEKARIAIPQGAMTKFWVGGFNRDWEESFLALRNDVHAQEEIRVFAQWIDTFLDNKANP